MIPLIVLYVKDLPRMAAFYGGLLGVAGSPSETWVEFAAGGVKLGLHAIPAHIAETIEVLSPPVAREDTPHKLIFLTDRTKVAELGGTLVERPWGGWDGIDPEGNVFGLTE